MYLDLPWFNIPVPNCTYLQGGDALYSLRIDYMTDTEIYISTKFSVLGSNHVSTEPKELTHTLDLSIN